MAKRDIKAAAGTRSRGNAPNVSKRRTKETKIKALRTPEDFYRRLDDIRTSDLSQSEKQRLMRASIESWRKRSAIHDVERAQAQHSPTIELTVDYPVGRQRVVRNPTRVRQSEAWRYNQLTPMQRQAETEMQFVWTIRTAGLAAAVSNYGRPRGGAGGRIDSHADAEATWVNWASGALSQKIHISAVIDCIAEPMTLKDIERAHKLKTGEALRHYQDGLDLWAELRGWKRRLEPMAVDTESTLAP